MNSHLQQQHQQQQQQDPHLLERLTRLVLGQTNGNPLYIVEFIFWLQQAEFLTWSSSSKIRSNYTSNNNENDYGIWTLCSQEDREATILLDKPGDFLMDMVNQLSNETKQVMKVCACLGSSIDPEVLEYVLDFTGVEKVLDDMVKRRFLVKRHNNKIVATDHQYTFGYDGIQKTVYSCIPENERELFHLEIGRRLWRKLNKEQLDSKLFVVLSQMFVGRRLITRENERFAVSTLCLHAGWKAAKSSTFRTAALYLKMGIDLLDTNVSWRRADQYDLTLSLHCAAAEMELCCARFHETYHLIDVVLKNARTFEDKLQAYTTKMFALSQDDRKKCCIDLGLWVLDQLGIEKFPKRLCTTRLITEFYSVEKLLRGKSNELLLRMSPITNKNQLQALRVLNFMILPAIIQVPKLAPFVYLKCMKITLLYGSSVFAAGAYGVYGMLCVGVMGNVEKGARFAQLALQSLEQYKVYEYLPRVYAAVYGVIYPWTKSIKNSLKPLLHAYRVGMSTGDAEYGGLCANMYCYIAIDSGIPLEVICREWRGFKETLESTGQAYLLRQFVPTLQTCHHFMGISDDPLSTKGDVMDYEEYEKEAIERQTQTSVGSLKKCKMMLGYCFGDTMFAEENVLSCKEVLMLPPTYERIQVLFYMGLIYIQSAREGREYRKKVRYSCRVLKYLKKYCEESPDNLLDKYNLVSAEYESLLGNNKKAHVKYLTAIAICYEKANHFMHALCNERFARHLLRLSDEDRSSIIDNSTTTSITQGDTKDKAKMYLKRSIQSYHDWGGMAKVTRLQSEMESIYGPSSCRKLVMSGRRL